jgi:hypothetical protein
MTADEHMAELEADNARLRADNGALQVDNATLREQVPARQQSAFRAQYRALLARARRAHPPPDTPRRPGQRGRVAQSPHPQSARPADPV